MYCVYSLKDAKQSCNEIFVVLATFSYKEIRSETKLLVLNKWTIIDETHDNKNGCELQQYHQHHQMANFARMLNFLVSNTSFSNMLQNNIKTKYLRYPKKDKENGNKRGFGGGA